MAVKDRWYGGKRYMRGSHENTPLSGRGMREYCSLKLMGVETLVWGTFASLTEKRFGQAWSLTEVVTQRSKDKMNLYLKAPGGRPSQTSSFSNNHPRRQMSFAQ